MSTVQAPLSYRFKAVFKDGRCYRQNESDTAVTKASGTAFSDIVDYLNDLSCFSLYSKAHDSFVQVNLETGLFTVNGLEVNIAPQNFIATSGYKLVYFREVRRDMVVSASGEEESHKAYVNKYFVGWEATDHKGQVIQRTISIAP